MQKQFIYDLLRKAVLVESTALDRLKMSLPKNTSTKNLMNDILHLKEIEGYYSGYFNGIYELQLLYLNQLSSDFLQSNSKIPKIEFSSTIDKVQDELDNFENQKIRSFQLGTSIVSVLLLIGIGMRLKYGEKWHSETSFKNTITLLTTCSAISLGFIGIRYKFLQVKSNSKCRNLLITANKNLLAHIELLKAQSPVQNARLALFKEMEAVSKSN